ncbi:NAD(P)/FAD-dependent oxidoreductase [Lichenifustis flavocetrariae]|uniref:FAD-binding oxidoreductase n=1 Tax=Lichenifustis flavocetrariae TaxID=2949735 RepID=A0AA41YX83_9HYPH|nr:FAD-dependent oxidoreductase [Lichenifustis flavocetrariae]MCW6508842.1 FAD-binding oxidoreductase [Lichenifustis flavocetrariae]
MTLPSPRGALVIGGGIVGLSIGLALQARGLAVTMVDAAGERAPASAGNAGQIAVEQHEPLASLAMIRALPRRLMSMGGPVSFPPGAVGQWLPFGLRLIRAVSPSRFAQGKQALGALLVEALPAWRRLMGDIGASDLLRNQGNIVAWESVAGARRARAALQGYASPAARWRDLTAAEAEALGGQLRSAPADAVRFEGTASVADPAAVLDALRAAFLGRGGTVEVRTATLAEARRSGADLVIVAAGVRSARLMREIGHEVPLIAERGYHIQSAQSRWPMDLTSVLFEERALVATRFRSGLRATSFIEFTHPDAEPDPRKWERLKNHAHDLGLPFDSPVETWYGSRPTLPDYLPAIGRSSRDPRVLYAFGHQHLGLTLGPITGDLVASLAFAEAGSMELGPFAVERFGR